LGLHLLKKRETVGQRRKEALSEGLGAAGKPGVCGGGGGWGGGGGGLGASKTRKSSHMKKFSGDPYRTIKNSRNRKF